MMNGLNVPIAEKLHGGEKKLKQNSGIDTEEQLRNLGVALVEREKEMKKTADIHNVRGMATQIAVRDLTALVMMIECYFSAKHKHRIITVLIMLFCLFICSVLSAVGILVPALARVVIGLALGLKLVDDDAEDPASALLELGDDLLRLTALQLAVADDEQGAVTAVGCDSRINDPAKGRGVDKDIVIALSLLLYQRGKILSAEKLDRIRRIFAGEDDTEVRVLGRKGGFLRSSKPRQHFAEPDCRLGIGVSACHYGFAHISVYDENLLPKLGEAPAQMQCDGGLAFVFVVARQCDDLDVLAAELDVGTEYLIGFLSEIVLIARQ